MATAVCDGAEFGIKTAGGRAGVLGAEDAGDADSTSHMRWEWVATSFATVCASVEYGVT